MNEGIGSFLRELRFAARSLLRIKGLTATVIVTLALGIGANSAMFSLVRGVLLRPLVNRDEGRLIYISQTSSVGSGNARFSVPEIADLSSRVKTLNSFGDFSTVGFTMVGLGEPRSVQAGVVSGSYFRVMGLRPVLGRLLGPADDGPNASGAIVLTYRFWATAMRSDPKVLGKSVRLDSFFDARPATVVGVLEPCVPYPADTEIIGNIVTSSHHLSATMVGSRIHRMTDLFARLAPGSNLEKASAELNAAYIVMQREHPEAYPANADFRIRAVRLRDQLTSGARTILLVLMATSVLVFVIACANVANLILARTVRRENELGVRAALGASEGALRRTLLAESLLLCVAGATLGLLIASPLVGMLSRYMSRFSIRALDLTLDGSMLWVGAALAVVAAGILAFVPRLPSSGGPQGFGLSSGSARVTGGANQKLRVFAVVQIAASFVLVASAGATVRTLLALEAAQTGFDTQHVLAVDMPVMHTGRTPGQIVNYYRETTRRILQLPGVQNVAVGSSVPWRDDTNISLQFSASGRAPGAPGEDPRAEVRITTPGFFATLGLPLIEGRDFTDSDRDGGDSVAIVSQSVAQRMFPNHDALNQHVVWTDPILKVFPLMKSAPMRIIGVVQDVDDTNVVPRPTMTLYRPFDQEPAVGGGRLFIHTTADPYSLVSPIKRIVRNMSADQPVENAATLNDIRAKVLSPDRLSAAVFSVFAGVALLIAVVGVVGVLTFSVSGRTREFGIRLAVGSQPRRLLMLVIAEGATIACAGLAAGLISGYALARLAGSYLPDLKMPGMLPVASAASILLLAAIIGSVIPAARAARVDVLQALRTE